MMNIIRDKKAFFEFAFVTTAVFAVIFYGKECSQGVLNGIYFCANVLVPSIFPFMAVSVFTAKSAVSEKFGRVSGFFTERLFGVSKNLGAVLLMSMIGGYPVGAKGISALRETGAISESDAKAAAYTAFGAGPGFLITFVGNGLISSAEIGACLLFSQIVSIIIIGVMNKYIFGKNKVYNSDTEIKYSPLHFSDAVAQSVLSALYGMLEMCGMVVIFSAILGITEKLLGELNVYASVLLEVTSACSRLSSGGNILLIAFATGFGGLCVHFQVFTALKNIKINKALFFFIRIIQGVITALLTILLIKIFNISLPVFSSISYKPELGLSTSAIGSVLLILCGVCFINNTRKT